MQNVKDLLASREVENIFETYDLVLVLNQADGGMNHALIIAEKPSVAAGIAAALALAFRGPLCDLSAIHPPEVLVYDPGLAACFFCYYQSSPAENNMFSAGLNLLIETCPYSPARVPPRIKQADTNNNRHQPDKQPLHRLVRHPAVQLPADDPAADASRRHHRQHGPAERRDGAAAKRGK